MASRISTLFQNYFQVPTLLPTPTFSCFQSRRRLKMSKTAKAVALIIANETLEKMSSIGAGGLLYYFLTDVFNMSEAQALNIGFIFNGVTNMAPIVGAIFSDSFFGRFRTLAFSTPCSLLGMVLLTVTALSGMHPSKEEAAPRWWQLAVLYSSFLFFTLGAAGIRSCNLAFGIDQYDMATEAGKRGKQRFISWNYASFTVSVMVAFIVFPIIQKVTGSWVVGFLVPTAVMLVSCILFFAGSRLYVKSEPEGSPVVSVVRVFVACFRNRKLPVPSDRSQLFSNPSDDVLPPTNQLRFLEKAAIMTGDQSSSSPWKLCSIQQVEDAKCVVRVAIMWAPAIIYQLVAADLGSYGGQVAPAMDTRIGRSSVHIPPATMPIFSSISLVAWLVVQEKVIVPLVAKKKIRTTPPPPAAEDISDQGADINVPPVVFLSTLQRMGIGMLLSTLAAAVAGIVEGKRRSSSGGKSLSIFWQVPQRVLIGLAEALNNPAQIDFYHGELPASISSLTGAFFAMGYAFGSFAGSILDAIVRAATRSSPGGRTWLTKDPAHSRLDCLFFLLAGLSAVNLAFFILLVKYYRHRATNGN